MSVTDVGVAVTNLRVVCKIITCVPAVTEMANISHMRLAPGTLPWRTLTFMEIICHSLVIRLRLQIYIMCVKLEGDAS